MQNIMNIVSHTLATGLFLSLTIGAADASPHDTDLMTEKLVGQVIDFDIEKWALEDVDETVHADLAELSLAVAQTALSHSKVSTFNPRTFPKTRVIFRGKGAIEHGPVNISVGRLNGNSKDDEEAQPGNGIVRWDTVSLTSGNEFRVEFPRKLLRQIGHNAEEKDLNLGMNLPNTEGASESDEGYSKALSNGIDGRVLRGTYDQPQTHSAYRRLVNIGGCSGTMIGPKHIITAAHCIRDFRNSRWVAGSAQAGRSGQKWRASVSFSTSSAWYWTPARFRELADGRSSLPFSATPYDIGVIVTHNSRMGNVVGWMGWWYWDTDYGFGTNVKYNRGYPVCTSQADAPASCRTDGLYGDVSRCLVGNHSSPDSDGINRRFRHSCDTSGGHSGSSLYHYRNNGALVVTGIHSWSHCRGCSSSDSRPSTGVRITKEYSDMISFLRTTFP